MNMEYLQKLHAQRFQRFKSQNPETGRFDVIFEIEGKLLYAHRTMLTLVSNTFDAMLSERWNGNSDDKIKIEGNSFEDFCNFVHFLYSGSCQLNAENLYTMIDIAEFYNVGAFKKYCEEYALEIEYNLANIFQLLKIAIRYSMKILKAELFEEFIVSDFAQFSDAEEFLSLDYAIMNEIVAAVKNDVEPETLFKALFKWSEQQATNKQNSSIDDTFNLNEAIKNVISPFLPLIQFELMEIKFVADFVAKKRFVFSYDQFSAILQKCCELKIKITNSKKESIVGHVSIDDAVVPVLKNLDSDSSKYCKSSRQYYFKTMLKAPPLMPSQIEKADKDCWYLFYYSTGAIGFKHSSEVGDNYIICEMMPEKAFST